MASNKAQYNVTYTSNVYDGDASVYLITSNEIYFGNGSPNYSSKTTFNTSDKVGRKKSTFVTSASYSSHDYKENSTKGSSYTNRYDESISFDETTQKSLKFSGINSTNNTREEVSISLPQLFFDTEDIKLRIDVLEENDKFFKASFGNYYTKSEVDSKVNEIKLNFRTNNYYTKTETNGLISDAKTEVLDTVSANYYTKTQTDNLLSDAKTEVLNSVSANYYNKDYINNNYFTQTYILNNYYTKTSTDGKISDKIKELAEAMGEGKEPYPTLDTFTRDSYSLFLLEGTDTPESATEHTINKFYTFSNSAYYSIEDDTTKVDGSGENNIPSLYQSYVFLDQENKDYLKVKLNKQINFGGASGEIYIDVYQQTAETTTDNKATLECAFESTDTDIEYKEFKSSTITAHFLKPVIWSNEIKALLNNRNQWDLEVEGIELYIKLGSILKGTTGSTAENAIKALGPTFVRIRKGDVTLDTIKLFYWNKQIYASGGFSEAPTISDFRVSGTKKTKFVSGIEYCTSGSTIISQYTLNKGTQVIRSDDNFYTLSTTYNSLKGGNGSFSSHTERIKSASFYSDNKYSSSLSKFETNQTVYIKNIYTLTENAISYGNIEHNISVTSSHVHSIETKDSDANSIIERYYNPSDTDTERSWNCVGEKYRVNYAGNSETWDNLYPNQLLVQDGVTLPKNDKTETYSQDETRTTGTKVLYRKFYPSTKDSAGIYQFKIQMNVRPSSSKTEPSTAYGFDNDNLIVSVYAPSAYMTDETYWRVRKPLTTQETPQTGFGIIQDGSSTSGFTCVFPTTNSYWKQSSLPTRKNGIILRIEMTQDCAYEVTNINITF